MANNDNDNFLCFDQSGNPLDTENSCSNIDNLYKIVIKKQTSTDIFLITVSWSSLIGGQDNVELVYGT
jgi:hypothetical protein